MTFSHRQVVLNQNFAILRLLCSLLFKLAGAYRPVDFVCVLNTVNTLRIFLGLICERFATSYF